MPVYHRKLYIKLKSERTRRTINKAAPKISKCLILLYGLIWCCNQDLIPPELQSTTAATRVSSRKVSRCLPMLIFLNMAEQRLAELYEGLSGAIGTLLLLWVHRVLVLR